MSRKFRIWCGVLSGLLAVWALFLVMAPITLTFYGDDELEVRCNSVLGAGWNSRIFTETDGSRSYRFDVVRGRISVADGWELQDRMESKCDRKRTTNLALTALLLAPASVLAASALMPDRKLSISGSQTAPPRSTETTDATEA